MNASDDPHPSTSKFRTRCRLTPTTRFNVPEFRTSKVPRSYVPDSNRTSVSVLHARATNSRQFALEIRATCSAGHPLSAHRTRCGDEINARSMLKHPSALSSTSEPPHILRMSAKPLDVSTLQLSSLSVLTAGNFERTVFISSVTARRLAHLFISNVSHFGAYALKVSSALHPAALIVSTEPDCTCSSRNEPQSATFTAFNALESEVRRIEKIVIDLQLTAFRRSSRVATCAPRTSRLTPEQPVTSNTRKHRATSRAP
mmetsp:Transcript_3811/g.14663  ORF Transcript_3811/g.14663 Transcript_3811/m.14663 type:complete len:258 (-) Transcript_3811:811-1584(-)